LAGPTGPTGATGPSGVAANLNSVSDVTITSASSGQLLTFSGNEWVNQNLQRSQLPAGSILQVVSTTKTDVYDATVGTDAITPDIPGMSATITPTFQNSLILVMISLNVTVGSSGTILNITYRNGSPVFIGNAAGNRRRSSSGGLGSLSSAFSLMTTAWSFLDSPNSLSAQTYTMRSGHATSGNLVISVNRSSGDNDVGRVGRGASSITLIEVRQ
jgi:hypothetical protein